MDDGDAKTAGEEGGLARKRQASLCGSVHLSIYFYKLLVKIKQCALSYMNYIDVSILCSCSFFTLFCYRKKPQRGENVTRRGALPTEQNRWGDKP